MSDVAVQGSRSTETEEEDSSEQNNSHMKEIDVAVLVGGFDEADTDPYERPKHLPSYMNDKNAISKTVDDKGQSLLVKHTTTPLPVLPVVARGHQTYQTFTNLHRWEYENGFTVDGVTNVQQWARDVGLAPGSDDPQVQQ